MPKRPEPARDDSVAGGTVGADAVEQEEPTLAGRIGGVLFDGVLILVGAVIIATLIRAFVGQLFLIPSGSMENTLQVDDRVAVSKFGGFHRGDVVVFEDPGAWLTPGPAPERGFTQQALEFIGVLPNSETKYLIKRVIGMPGDNVCTRDGQIEVNGHRLDESAYLYSADGVMVAPSELAFNVTVPAGHVFLLGDHRNNSNDSRYKLAFGTDDPAHSPFVSEGNVEGAAVAIVSPWSRLATFTRPTVFDAVPEPASPAPEVGIIGPGGEGCS